MRLQDGISDGGGEAASTFARVPYVSSGGFSMPTIGSTFSAPGAAPNVPSAPSAFAPSGGGAAHATPISLNVPSFLAGASGTPTYVPDASGGSTVPSTSPDYFSRIVDLIEKQLTTGQSSAPQSFAASPVVLPSGGAYSGSAGSADAGGSGGGGAAGRPVVGYLVLLAIVGGAAYYWFIYRKRGGAA